MTDLRDVGADLRGLLDAVEAAPPVDAVDVLARELAQMVGATDVTFLIADFSGNALIRLVAATTDDPDSLERVPLPGSPHERSLRSQEVQVEEVDGGVRAYAPVTDRGDALGVLELSLDGPPSDDDVAFIASSAHALAYVVIANRRHTDLFERGQRSRSFSLAGEMQRRLLPQAFTCEAAELTLAGWLEPAHKIGGDTFDYCVERDVLHVSISDAMGHDVRAAQLATLAVNSLRNSRRGDAGPVEQATAANDAIIRYADGEEYVSAIVVRVDLPTGLATVINAGHAHPFLVRDGRARRYPLDADLPLGMFPGTHYREQAVQLLPGDRLVLLTDGMLERNASSIDVVAALHEMGDLHPREVVHTFAHAVLGATDGDLRDDATVVCVDWYGRDERARDRISSSGATQSLASADD